MGGRINWKYNHLSPQLGLGLGAELGKKSWASEKFYHHYEYLVPHPLLPLLLYLPPPHLLLPPQPFPYHHGGGSQHQPTKEAIKVTTRNEKCLGGK